MGVARSGDRTVSHADIEARDPTGHLSVPFREIDGLDNLALGLRMGMLDVGNLGGVSTGGGCGSDYIILEWRGRHLLIRGSDLLRSWVATWADDDQFWEDTGAFRPSEGADDDR